MSHGKGYYQIKYTAGNQITSLTHLCVINMPGLYVSCYFTYEFSFHLKRFKDVIRILTTQICLRTKVLNWYGPAFPLESPNERPEIVRLR